jgi:hypothetical protein
LTTPPIFPQLAGQGWSVHKRPTFSTRVASHVSGREVRSSLYATTLYEFELTFDALTTNSGGSFVGLGAASLQTLLGFYLQCQGQLGTFLYLDPSDSVAKTQAIATGDGITTSFALCRTLGTFTEPVSWVTQLTAVYVNGTLSSGWTLATPNILTLASAPAAGATVSADFTYAFLCRFLDDQEDFENVMSGLWTVSTLKFRSVRT